MKIIDHVMGETITDADIAPKELNKCFSFAPESGLPRYYLVIDVDEDQEEITAFPITKNDFLNNVRIKDVMV